MMKKLFPFYLFFLFTLSAGVLHAQESGQKLYRISVKDFSRIRTIENNGINVYDMNPGFWVEVQALPEQIESLKGEGFDVEFIANSFNELYQDYMSLKTSPPFHDYKSTNAELAAIASAHPVITKLDTIGYSVLGRAICCLKISDNPSQDEDEPPILVVGAHHGNEVHSVEATLFQISHLVDNYGIDQEVTSWIDNMEIWYVPLMNPDGREAMRRANDHGVDLNRNYSVGFTAGGSHGPEAFSEPENRAIRDLAARYPPVMSLTYHTSGQYILYSWTHSDEAAPDSSAMIYLGGLISQSIARQGTSGDHYTLLQGGRWYFTAGEYCDYMYVTHNTLAFTVEMGTSQSPDYSVVPVMVESNLQGLKTMLRQVGRAGVTGLVTDAVTGLPVRAVIDIPSIDRQGKVPLRLTDSLFGRYYRYLAPGDYPFEVSAPGYRNVARVITISPDSLIHWDIKMEKSAFLRVDELILTDGNTAVTSGNGDGRINLGETIGLSARVANLEAIGANRVHARIGSESPYIQFLTDTLFFGTIEGHQTASSTDTVLFRIDPNTPDGENLGLTITIGDSGGFGWEDQAHFEVYAPEVGIKRMRIDDSAGNNNGVIDNGETVTIELLLANNGRQCIHGLTLSLTTEDTDFQVVSSQDNADQLDADNAVPFSFSISLSPDAPKALIADFTAELSSAEGYSPSFAFELHNIDGFYDNYENGENGWTHASYGTTSNHHDDWQLGTPMGKERDPGHAWSGENCWGTDLGYDSYQGQSWDGLYQANVYNYLASPMINCTGMNDAGLRIMRVLNTRVGDYARIRVNGEMVWESAYLGHLDSVWTEQIIDISDIADDNPEVRIIFELQSNSVAQLGGWNIDDVILANGLMSGSTSAESAGSPTVVGWTGSFPNPFSSSTTIRYNLPANAMVELCIYDLAGNRIKTLVTADQSSGLHQLEWNGTNGTGQDVVPGIYLYRIKAGHFDGTGRLVLIR